MHEWMHEIMHKKSIFFQIFKFAEHAESCCAYHLHNASPSTRFFTISPFATKPKVILIWVTS